MIFFQNRYRHSQSVLPFLQRLCFFCLLMTPSLWGGRVIVRTLEGDFEQEYRIVEQAGIWRIDATTKFWSILYDSHRGQYTGLEHRDGAYWEFRWQDVQKAIQGTKHHFNRLSDLNIEGFSSYDLTRPANEKEKIEPWRGSKISKVESWMKLDSRFWELDQREKGEIRAQTVTHPFIKEFFNQFIPIHDQIRQAAVRPFWPEKVDEALIYLRAQEEVGVKLEWGSRKNPSYWKIARFEEQSSEPEIFFQIPKKYHPTTIESLRGLLNNLEGKP